MIIRQATRYDLHGVLKCLNELNKEYVNFFTRKRVKQLLKQEIIAVATVGTEIAGVCIVRNSSPYSLEVFALAINPDYQKLGIGTKLLRWAEAFARFDNYQVVRADSYYFYNAKGFYEKNGYEAIEVLYGYTFLKDWFDYAGADEYMAAANGDW